MVLVHIISKEETQAMEIVDFLLNRELVLDAWVSEKSWHGRGSGVDSAGRDSSILIMCKTKALLFSAIDEALTEYYGEDMPLLYAVPIVYMNENQAAQLRAGTLKV